jgi:hypothetical protein
MRVGVWVAATLAVVACVSAGCGGDNFQFCNGCPTNTPTVTPTDSPTPTPTSTVLTASNGAMQFLTPDAPAPTPLAAAATDD